ncbi:siphovirus ReqiPepy6 Gp37-like family protein [Ruminococcus sp.]|uniref:siphovirus ReqiPepy6 Gp37-like family protein n=1 Tax=Ruminococcus sp. TaxID=41978 RepID=UPI0025FFCCFF|nr:siphovirus ReqiPepy6 Gp37-like family protein [Ruminococcus sp.]
MQIEIYNMIPVEDKLSIILEAICDSFSSLLWDVEYYSCGAFEVYIAASPQNIEIFQTGRIVGRDDDNEHYGLIESVEIQTDAEDGDYLIVRGRFLMCLLERRIIYPTVNFTKETSYSDIIKSVVLFNAVVSGVRRIPGLSFGTATGSCWEQKTKLQISYDNLMRWVYTICEKIGGTANIRLSKKTDKQYEMILELSQGSDRSIMQSDNPHIVFSNGYNNLLSFSYATDISVQKNFAYILGKGEGEERKRTTYFNGSEPAHLDRYEVYVDAKDMSDEEQENGETKPIPEAEYIELLKEKGKQSIVLPLTASESQIAVQSTQFQYSKDYFVGDYVTVEHRRFGLRQNKIQLIGMIESFDRNGRNLTPTFKEV